MIATFWLIFMAFGVPIYFSEHVKVLNLSSLAWKPVYVCLYLNPVLRQLCDLQPHSNLKCMTCISDSSILARSFLRVVANGFQIPVLMLQFSFLFFVFFTLNNAFWKRIFWLLLSY